jgi:hypothetical protein
MGEDRPGSNGVDADIVLAVVEGRRIGQPDNPVLGRDVAGDPL